MTYPKHMGHIDAGVLADLLEAADAAERKLGHEYRRLAEESGEHARQHESWAEGERLHAALVNFRAHWQGQAN